MSAVSNFLHSLKSSLQKIRVKLMTILLFLIFLFPISVFAIGADDCPTIDYTNRFPSKVKDQKDRYLCASMAAIALSEEQMCLDDPENCGKELSVLDATRIYFNVLTEAPGAKKGVPVESIAKLALAKENPRAEQGICLESQAPYDQISKKRCQNIDGSPSPGCVIERLKEFYGKWFKIVGKGLGDQCDCSKENPLYSFELVNNRHLLGKRQSRQEKKIVKIMAEILKQQISMDVDIYRALEASNGFESFLTHTLITPQCKKNRFTLSASVTGMREFIDFAGKDDQDKHLEIVRALEKGHSAALSVCAIPIVSGSKVQVNPENRDECGNHALVVAGMRFVDYKAYGKNIEALEPLLLETEGQDVNIPVQIIETLNGEREGQTDLSQNDKKDLLDAILGLNCQFYGSNDYKNSLSAIMQAFQYGAFHTKLTNPRDQARKKACQEFTFPEDFKDLRVDKELLDGFHLLKQ